MLTGKSSVTRLIASAMALLRISAPDQRTYPSVTRPKILGLDLASSGELGEDLAALIAERDEARAVRDFARADAIRDRLRESGIELLDSDGSTTWVRR